MNNDHIRQDPAFLAMTLDFLDNMLSSSDNPGELSRYLTQEIRELTGARCVLLTQCVQASYEVIDVNPQRLRSWAESQETQSLYEAIHEFKQARLWDMDRPSEVSSLLRKNGFELSIMVPLRVGQTSVGAMLLLGLHDEHHMESEIKLLNTLSKVLALVLRNALIYDNQEKAIEERTKELKLYGFTIDNMMDAVFWVNPDAGFQKINSSACGMLGYSIEQLSSLSMKDISLELSDERWCENWERLKQAGTMRYETVFIAKNGRKIPVDISADYFDFDGKECKCAIVRDITEQKKIESRLQQAQKMESIGNLAGGVAHDFNNILFPIIGRSEMLLEDLPEDSSDYENALEIFKAGRRAGELVKQILAFSRQSEHEMTPIRWQSVIKEVLKLCRSTIPANIDIYQNIQTDCGMVFADMTHLHQVCMNLITNALHAVEKINGKITVVLKEIVLEKNDLPHGSIVAGTYAMLTVSDNGIGIEPDIMGRLFEPYFTTKEKGKGTGLGLAVVYGIVKGYRGEIKVYSEIGKGAVFTVYLPVIKKSGEFLPDSIVLNSPRGTERILLVDDEESIVRIGKLILERLGYMVSEFTSSVDALKAFKEDPHSFDLVISDMTMPYMTGDELAKELLLIRLDIPIIICTGFTERMNREDAGKIGVKGFLMKPVIKSELAGMVRDVLDRSGK